MRRLLAACFALSIVATVRAGQDQALPEPRELFTSTEQNLVKSQREQAHYAYRERRTDVHVNPLGKIGTDGSRVYDVMPGKTPDVIYRTLIERDGTPVTDSTPERIEQRRRERPAGARNPIEEALALLDFKIERRELVEGRPMVVVAFAPKPDAKPSSRAQKLATQFKGQVWVDESAREVARVDAVAIDDLTFGFGLLAHLDEGTRVTLKRQKVDSTAWFPTQVRFKGEGRAMLFRKLVVDYGIDWFDYRRVN